MNLSTRILLALTLAAVQGFAWADSQRAWSSECARRIVAVEYPGDALKTGLAGIVSATLAVDASGAPTKLRSEGPRLLADAVEVAIRKTTFPPACDERSVSTKFTFRIDNALPQQPLVSACFEGDRGFYVFAAKLKMVCSHFENVVALTGKDGLKPITVCDVVANPNAYAGRDVAVLGRLGQTMEGAWLSEDHCEKQIETDGYVWPSSIWIAGDRTAPDPPLGLLVLDGDALSEKVASVRGTTVLRTVKTVCWTPSEKPHQCEVQENWSVIYGRIETQQILRRPNGSVSTPVEISPVRRSKTPPPQ
jgi:hypothetical protein